MVDALYPSRSCQGGTGRCHEQALGREVEKAEKIQEERIDRVLVGIEEEVPYPQNVFWVELPSLLVKLFVQ